jgi:ketosteroid isomerase-like protein
MLSLEFNFLITIKHKLNPETMKLFTKSMALAVLMLASVSLLAQKGGDDKLKAMIQDYNNAMCDAMVKGDHEMLYSFYDVNVISMPNYGEMVRGIEAMKAHQAEAEAMGNKVLSMTMTAKQVTDYGDVLVEIGFFNIKMQIASMPAPVTDSGKYLAVWKKHGKEYKILNEIWNTNVHPMMAAQKGGEKPSPALDDKKGSGLEPAISPEDAQKQEGQLKSGGKKKGSNKKPKPDDN